MLNGARVTRAIYIGADDALETRSRLAEFCVGPERRDKGLWGPSVRRPAEGSTRSRSTTFLSSEAALAAPQVARELPPREIPQQEMSATAGRVRVPRQGLLDEEDIFAATFLVTERATTAREEESAHAGFSRTAPSARRGGRRSARRRDDEVVANLYEEGRPGTKREAPRDPRSR